MEERPVKPSDCALALCIPLTKEAFFADLDPAAPKDFVKSRASSFPGMAMAERWEDYAPIVRTATRVRAELEPLGVTFVPHTTLADFGALLARYAVVTLVAHWRFAPFDAGDVLDIAGLVRKLSSPRSPIQRFMAAALQQRGRHDLLEPNDHSGRTLSGLREALVTEIQDLLKAGHAFYTTDDGALKPRVESGAETDRSPLRLTRAALEVEFPDEIRPGGAIEFHDGLKTIDQVTRAIPTDFDGVIDLTVCNSVLLAESIKRRRRRALIICNKRPAAIQARLIRYKYIIKELARVKDTEPPNNRRFTEAAFRLSAASLERLLS